ncbi:MAG: putative addiction module antidote protein [Chloroflexota bacterium]|nr:putative addiction module antidote protein [Chloroflexota bacterium]MDE2884440.1 putative addiction module antidote protein [Chloroflexota bacterium]
MSEEYRRFDAADYVKTEEDIQGLLSAAVDEDTGDGAVIRAALKYIAQKHNMSALARATGLNRGNLYEALSDGGNPTLATLLKVTAALGLRLRLEPVEDGVAGAQPARAGSTQQG